MSWDGMEGTLEGGIAPHHQGAGGSPLVICRLPYGLSEAENTGHMRLPALRIGQLVPRRNRHVSARILHLAARK